MIVDDYFYTSWGYDQTNIDFITIVKVNPSGKTVTCRMCHKIKVGETLSTNAIIPGISYGEIFAMRVQGQNLRGFYPFCNSDKRLDTFYPAGHGVEFETKFGFGH